MLVAAALMMQASPSVAAMQDRRRILIVAAPTATDPRLVAQRNTLAGWRGAADRDVTVVEVVGDTVTGASDTATSLRHQYRLPATRFAVALVGKDGHVALRADQPILAERLQGRIDAMPMRRAGQR